MRSRFLGRAAALAAAALTLMSGAALAGDHAGAKHSSKHASTRHAAKSGYSIGHDGEGFRYAVVRPSRQGGEGLWINGSTRADEWKALRRLIDRDPREVFYVRLDGRSYVTRDEDAIAKAHAILAPLSRIGERQSALGERQAELGGRQSALGGRQAELGGRQSELGAELAAISDAMADHRSRAERRALERRAREIQLEMSELGARMSELGRQQSVLGEAQSELGRHQSALGRQQSEASAKAQVAMREHAEELLAAGVLEPLD